MKMAVNCGGKRAKDMTGFPVPEPSGNVENRGTAGTSAFQPPVRQGEPLQFSLIPRRIILLEKV